MKFKLILAALLVSGSVFAAGTGMTSVGSASKEIAPGSGRGSVIEGVTNRGDKEAQKKLEVQIKEAQNIQQRASNVEEQAQADLATPEAVAAGKNIAAKIQEKLKDCVSGLCNAFKGQISKLAEKGDYNASTVLRNGLISLKNKSVDKTEAIKTSLIEAGKNPKEIEKACGDSSI